MSRMSFDDIRARTRTYVRVRASELCIELMREIPKIAAAVIKRQSFEAADSADESSCQLTATRKNLLWKVFPEPIGFERIKEYSHRIIICWARLTRRFILSNLLSLSV